MRVCVYVKDSSPTTINNIRTTTSGLTARVCNGRMFTQLHQSIRRKKNVHGINTGDESISTIKQQLVDQKKRKIELGIMNDNEGSQTYSTCLNNG